MKLVNHFQLKCVILLKRLKNNYITYNKNEYKELFTKYECK